MTCMVERNEKNRCDMEYSEVIANTERVVVLGQKREIEVTRGVRVLGGWTVRDCGVKGDGAAAPILLMWQQWPGAATPHTQQIW